VLSIVDATIGGELCDDNINRVKRVARHNPHGEQRWFHMLSRKGSYQVATVVTVLSIEQALAVASACAR
jgi:hypothetical protein